MATFTQDLKKSAVRSIGRSMFGSGLVGSALGKTFVKKFAGQETEDTQVADALEEQSQVQQEVNATLFRLETVVTNIADNIYNIAGVWSKHVASMEEARQAQRERMSREAAAQEEATAEMAGAVKVDGPTAAGTAPGEEAKGGLLSKILDSVASTKKVLGSVLKRFALGAAGLLAVGAVGAYAGTELMSSLQYGGNEQVPEEELEQEAEVQETSEQRLERLGVTPSTAGGGRGSVIPPLAVPSEAPASMMTSSSTTQDTSAPAQQQTAASLTSALSAAPSEAQSFRATLEILQNQLAQETDPAKRQQLLALIGIQQRGLEQAEKNQLMAGTSVSSSETTLPSIGTQPGATLSPPATSSAPSLTSPQVDTGQLIGNLSTSVAASGEPIQAANQIITNKADVGNIPHPQATLMPSPIADRGSLDNGITFTSGYGII